MNFFSCLINIFIRIFRLFSLKLRLFFNYLFFLRRFRKHTITNKSLHNYSIFIYRRRSRILFRTNLKKLCKVIFSLVISTNDYKLVWVQIFLLKLGMPNIICEWIFRKVFVMRSYLCSMNLSLKVIYQNLLWD